MKRVTLISLLLLISLVTYNCKPKEKHTPKKIETKKVFVVNKDSLIKMGLPKRITEQYAVIMENQKNNQKSFFIVDTRENLIFFFDKKGTFLVKSPTIDGFDKQSTNPKMIKEALNTWSSHCNDLGFKWDYKKGTYVDTTGQKRFYSKILVYNYLGVQKVRFLPKGIYKIPSKYFDPMFIGGNDNVYDLETIGGKPTSIAIHGVYQSAYRLRNIKILEHNIGSDFNKMFVSKNYRKLVLDNDNNSTFNNSYGCINVPSEFLKLTNDKAVGSLIFVIGESENNYLIK